MGFDASDLAGIPIMSYASAHEVLRQIDRQLRTIRKPYQGNEITGQYQKIENQLLLDLDGIRCLDRRAIQEIKEKCLRLNLMLDSTESILADMVRETLRGEMPERIRLAREIRSDLKPLKKACAWRFVVFLLIAVAIVVFVTWKLHST